MCVRALVWSILNVFETVCETVEMWVLARDHDLVLHRLQKTLTLVQKIRLYASLSSSAILNESFPGAHCYIVLQWPAPVAYWVNVRAKSMQGLERLLYCIKSTSCADENTFSLADPGGAREWFKNTVVIEWFTIVTLCETRRGRPSEYQNLHRLTSPLYPGGKKLQKKVTCTPGMLNIFTAPPSPNG